MPGLSWPKHCHLWQEAMVDVMGSGWSLSFFLDSCAIYSVLKEFWGPTSSRFPCVDVVEQPYLLTSPHPPLNYIFRDILMTHLFLVVSTYLVPLLGGNLLDNVGRLPSLVHTQTLLLLNTIPPLPFNYSTLCHISPKPSTHSHSRTLEDLNLLSLTS